MSLVINSAQLMSWNTMVQYLLLDILMNCFPTYQLPK